MSLDIKYIKDTEGNNYFPVVHERGVVDDNGTTLESKLLGKQDVLTFDSTPTASSTNPVTSGGVKSALDGKDNKVIVVNHGTNDTTFALTPNTYHIWGEVTSLDLTLATGESGVANEYMFRFFSGTTPTTLTLPVTVQWVQPLTCQQDKYYEVSIVNNLAAYITSGMVAAEGSGGTPEYATKDWVTNKIEAELDGGYYHV